MTREQFAWRRFDEANSKFWSGPARLVLGLIWGGLAIAWMVTDKREFLTALIVLIAVVTPLLLRADYKWATRRRSGMS